MTAAAGGRPPLPRFRFDVVLAIEVAAEDLDHAELRAEALADLLRYRNRRAIRGARIGSAEPLTADVVGDVSSV